jgi:SAM-dependent methyltransferase
MDRTERLRSMIDLSGHGLEIGPSYNPLVPKSEGFDVIIADYTDAAGLRAKYATTVNVDVGRIEDVDIVLNGSQSLSEAAGAQGSFDYIVASHVIEHTPDMLGFLLSCQFLLKQSGILLLAVPDKRHCFDALQPLTSTGAVLQAHLDGRTRPTPGAVFDDYAYNVVRNGAIGWAQEDTGTLRYYATLDDAKRVFEEAHGPGYIDVHVWRFVPSSFRLIMADLAGSGYLALREREFHGSIGNEFYMTFSGDAEGCGIDRLTLGRRAMIEQASIFVDE